MKVGAPIAEQRQRCANVRRQAVYKIGYVEIIGAAQFAQQLVADGQTSSAKSDRADSIRKLLITEMQKYNARKARGLQFCVLLLFIFTGHQQSQSAKRNDGRKKQNHPHDLIPRTKPTTM